MSRKATKHDDAVFRALANPYRRRMLDILRRRPRTTGDLALSFADLSRYAVMQHLRVLEGARLIVVRREGRHRWNHLNPVPIRAIYERWVSRYAEIDAEGLVGLKRHIEGSNG